MVAMKERWQEEDSSRQEELTSLTQVCILVESHLGMSGCIWETTLLKQELQRNKEKLINKESIHSPETEEPRGRPPASREWPERAGEELSGAVWGSLPGGERQDCADSGGQLQWTGEESTWEPEGTANPWTPGGSEQVRLLQLWCNTGFSSWKFLFIDWLNYCQLGDLSLTRTLLDMHLLVYSFLGLYGFICSTCLFDLHIWKYVFNVY